MGNKLMEQAVALSQQAVAGARRLQVPTPTPQTAPQPYTQIAQNNIAPQQTSNLQYNPIKPSYGSPLQEQAALLKPADGKGGVTKTTYSSSRQGSLKTSGTPDVEKFKAAIAKLESGGNYAAKSKTSTARGKYQYVKKTWNNYGGYKSADEAPPEIQERRMTEDTAKAMKKYNGNIALVAVAHFQGGGVADKIVKNPALWDKKDANGMTTRQYVAKFFKNLG